MGNLKSPKGTEQAANRSHSLNLSKASAAEEVRRRSPWIFVSVAAGVVMIAVGRGFEQFLAQNIALVFFLPTIVYMSDIIGTETLALVVREQAVRAVSIAHLLRREMVVGLALGGIAGTSMGAISYVWFRDPGLSLTVASAMFANGAVAVLMGVLIPIIFTKLRRDPAIGSDEVLTALSDTLSMTIYLAIAALILFS
jgi:magnesium transporter